MKNSLGNLAPAPQTISPPRCGTSWDRIQRRPGLITGFPGQAGLTLDPSHHRPWPFRLCSPQRHLCTELR
jgi:hypothetical protein